MKRLFLTVVLAAAGWCAYAQNYMIVDSEKIFKSIDAYNTAIKDLDKMAEDYQKQVDDKFAEIETLYNNYQQQKASLSATTRQVLEDTILSKEKDATALQESLFGKDGTLMRSLEDLQRRSQEFQQMAQRDYAKKQEELLQPIIEKAKAAIDKIAAAGGYLFVFDTSAGSLAYFDEAALTDLAPEVRKELGITDAPAAAPAAPADASK